MGNGMLSLGLLVGCTAGFLLTWWFARSGPPTEPFFLRFLRIENRSARVNTRLMIHELHCKVEELSATVRRMDGEMQEMFEKMRQDDAGLDKIRHLQPLPPKKQEAPQKKGPLPLPERRREVYRLHLEGLSPEEITEQLQLGRGEVELVISLRKKPSWVAGAKNLTSGR